MQQETVRGLLSDLKSCTMRKDLQRGRKLHAKAVENRNDENMYVVSALINMYAKCRCMVDARDVIDSVQKPDVVSWNALLLGYAGNGEGLVALEMFSRMKTSGCAPSSVTYLASLKACTLLAMREGGKENCLKRGREIHLEIGCHMKCFVQTALIVMYAKCGSMVDARGVFDSVQNPDVVFWNALLMGYAENGDGFHALEMFSRMKENGCTPSSVTFLAAIKACTSLVVNGAESAKEDCLKQGRTIHSEIGSHLDFYVQSSLIDMYAKCGSMLDAREVFDSIKKPDVVTWNALLLGYADNGQGTVALQMLSRMKSSGCSPSVVTYLAALKACTSLAVNKDGREDCLKRGRQIHSEIGCHLDHYMQNTLIDMYAKCGSMVDARYVFDNVQKPDVVSWNALLLGYASNGDGLVAMEMFSRMKSRGCIPDSVTYIAVLKACTSLAANGDDKKNYLEWGRKIHSQIGCHLNHNVQNTLIDMYAKCGSMSDARYVFDSVQIPDVVSWNALLLGYADNGNGLVALEMFSRMKARGCTPSSVTYLAALKACGLMGALALGRKFHLEIGEVDAYLLTGLVDFYAKCGSMVESRGVFDLYPETRDASTWNALLAGYASFGDSYSVFKLVQEMQDEGFQPNVITFIFILMCCSHAGLVEKAREYFGTMSAKYGVTPTIIHYTCMVDVLGRENRLNEAISVIRKMPCDPDVVIWKTLLGACRKWKNVEIGKSAFQSLVDMDKKDASAYVLMAHIYGSMGLWEEQERVLEERRQVGAWKPGKAYVMNVMGKMVTFSVEEQNSGGVFDVL